jgi:hypothetical protein
MSMLSIRGRLRAIILLPGLFAFPGCGSGRDARPQPALPVYSPEAARLFDDTFAPLLFGFDAEARDLARDLQLRERTRLASFILPARIETVSRVGLADRGAYEVTMVPIAGPLAGTYAGGPILVRVPASNPSYAWIEGAGARWVGTRVLAFGRFYAGTPRPALHFRCEADTEELRGLVGRDAALRSLR